MVGHHKRHRGRIHARWGATADGKVVVAEATCLLDAGAYNYTTNKVLGNLHLCVTGPYEIANVSRRQPRRPNQRRARRRVPRLRRPAGRVRGRDADEQAGRTRSGQDPVELRRRNVLRDGSLGPHRHRDAARRQPARGHRPVRGGGRAGPSPSGPRRSSCALRLAARRSPGRCGAGAGSPAGSRTSASRSASPSGARPGSCSTATRTTPMSGRRAHRPGRALPRRRRGRPGGAHGVRADGGRGGRRGRRTRRRPSSRTPP